MSKPQTLEEIQKQTMEYVKTAAAKYEGATVDEAKTAMPTETPSLTETTVGEDAKKSQPEVAGLVPETGKQTDEGIDETSDVTDAPSQDTTNKNVGEDGITASDVGGDVTDAPNTTTKASGVTDLGQSILDKLTPKKAEDAPEAPEATDAPAAKKADEASPAIKLDNDLLAKVAECILATEDGWKIAEAALAKQAGAEQATIAINELSKRAEEEILATKIAADQWDQGAQDAEALIMKVAQELDAQEQAASAEPEEGKKAEADEVKQAQSRDWDAGAKTAEALIKSAMDGLEGEGEMLPPEADALGPEEAMDAAGAMAAEDELSEEEALAVVEELLAAGLIDEATVQEIVGAIGGMGGEGEAMPAGAMLEEGGEMGGEELPPEADLGMPAEGDPGKMASAKKEETPEAKLASALDSAIANVKAKRTKETV